MGNSCKSKYSGKVGFKVSSKKVVGDALNYFFQKGSEEAMVEYDIDTIEILVPEKELEKMKISASDARNELEKLDIKTSFPTHYNTEVCCVK